MINIEAAKKYLGKPYVWGGDSMSEGGYDCSGFVYNVLKDSGYNVPRDTAQGYYKRYCLNRCEDKAGALLFFGKSVKSITHIAISLGNGQMIESMGGKTNTKNKPGKGVTISKVTRRKDLVAICSVDVPFISTVKKNIVIAQPTLRRGDMGMQVEYLQRDLNQFGYGCAPDGKFGNMTFNCLLDFQKKHGLIMDGIYGNQSYEKMRVLLWK